MFFPKCNIFDYKSANIENKIALKLMQKLYSFV